MYRGMITIAYNIGYDHKEYGGRVLSKTPRVFITNSIRDFTDGIRENVKTLIEWAKVNHVPKSTICLYILIREDHKTESDTEWEWEFMVRLKNVREYKVFLKNN
jgi:hypothetical protein